MFKAVLLGILLLLYATITDCKKSCPTGCAEHGTCYEEIGRCDCPWNFTGSACETRYKGFCVRKYDVNTCKDGHKSLCVNNCHDRGQCKGGFCHCSQGYFGTDCSLSYNKKKKIEILSGLNYKTNANGPKIYVYELPPEYHVKRDNHKVDRPPLHLAILERILTGGHRTTDGDNADYYYVPISSRDLKKRFLLLPAIAHIASKWKYWNATGGARHIIPMEGDVGTCELPIAVRTITQKVTWLQFWGMYDFHPSWNHIFYHKIPCFVAGRDIVVPFMAMSSHDRFMVETPLHPRNHPAPKREHIMFFAGAICGSGRPALPPNCTHYKQIRYSGGVRQLVYENFHERKDWKIVTKSRNFALDYSTSRFCLAAAGGGWGKRGIVSAMYGCLPVAVTDYVYEVFEPEIDWSHFGMRFSQRDIPQMAQVLEGLSEAQVAEKQRRVACAAQHFHWSGSLGGVMNETGEFDAFNTVMAILRARLHNPGVPPGKLYSVDPEFRKFADCESDHPGKHPPLCTMYTGPGMLRGKGAIKFQDHCPQPKYFMRRKIGPPGGAVCVGAKDLASCPRFD